MILIKSIAAFVVLLKSESAHPLSETWDSSTVLSQLFHALLVGQIILGANTENFICKVFAASVPLDFKLSFLSNIRLDFGLRSQIMHTRT